MVPRTNPITRTLAVGLTAGIALAGCSSGSSTKDAASDASSTTSSTAAVNSGATVEVTEYRFSPSQATVEKGQIVTWRNDGERTHIITQDVPDAERLFKSDNLDPDQSFQFQFGEAGSFAYICAIHPDTMKGSITVQ